MKESWLIRIPRIAPLVILCLSALPQCEALAAPPITPSGLNTAVGEPVQVGGLTQYNITGGTRPGGGTNLFHSFGEFGVPTNNIANFLNETALPTTNILGRVTGGNISNILGTIQTNGPGGFGNANLFLMNPAGFLFGPNAAVNVGGMVTFTSADYLRLTDGGRFNASPNPIVPDLLTASPVAAFGFLGSNPGSITVLGSQLTVADGTGISLVGGNITIQSGTLDDGTVQPARLSAPGGQINLASTAGPSEVAIGTYQPTPGMALGAISISEGSSLDVSAEAAGTVRIRGGQLELISAAINADTGNVDGAETAIDIRLTGDFSLSSDVLPALTGRSFGDGNAGAILANSANMNAVSMLPEVVALIDTHTEGAGNGGNVTLNTGGLTFTGNPGGFDFFIMSGTAGVGNGGNVSINAGTIDLRSARIDTGDAILGGLGSGGNVTFMGGDMNLDSVTFFTDSVNARGGNVVLDGRDISIVRGSQIGPLSLLGESTVKINARNFALKDGSLIFNQTALGTGGGITITSENAEFTQGSRVLSQTSGDADAGFIKLFATGTATFADSFDDPANPPARSGLFTNSLGDASLGTHGNAGAIDVSVGSLTIAGGARIDSTTQTNGKGGAITITATNGVSITGERPFGDTPESRASGIYTRTVGSELCAGPCGDAGSVTISTSSLTLGGGGTLNSDTMNNGNGGNIAVNAANIMTISGTMTDGTPSGIFSRTIGTQPDAGSGGNITLNAGQSVTISEGAQVSASTTGPGNAGNITVQGLTSPAQSVLIDGAGSGISTNTEGAGAGGNILVNADSVTVSNGSALSATTSGSGMAGNVNVLADQLQLTNFAAIATSTSGQGAAGTIEMVAQNSISAADSFINSNALSMDPGAGSGGQIILKAPTINVAGGNISTLTIGPGNAGDIRIQAGQFTLSATEGSPGLIEASTSGAGHGGNISVLGVGGPGSRANDVALSGLSSLRSTTQVTTETPIIVGSAGNITVDTVRLSLTEGSAITTASLNSSPGNAGNVTLNATDSVLVSGSHVTSDVLNGSTGNGGRITITTPILTVNQGADGFGGVAGGVISTSTNSSGNAGSVTIDTNNLTLADGGRIASSSVLDDPAFFPPATGAAGTVVIQGLNGQDTQANSIAMSGQDSFGQSSGLFTTTQGAGPAGDVLLSAQSVTLQNGAQVSSSSTGTGVAGNINLTAGNQFTLSNSSITTEATQSGGGIIKITTDPSGTVELSNSKISASVLDGTGGGGSVNIDPQFVILQNSQILAEAVQGPGGNINITITNGGLFLPDATSVVSASSQFGQSGTVTIQSPNAPAGGKIQPLGKAPLQVTALLSQRCAAIARGEVSSFVVAGRDTLPTEPGGWLPSPLAFGSPEAGAVVQAGNPENSSESIDPAILSLRRLPSPSKIAPLLAEDWVTDCTS